MALCLLPYDVRLLLSAGVLMRCKPVWWQALKAVNKKNVEEMSSLSKICLKIP